MQELRCVKEMHLKYLSNIIIITMCFIFMRSFYFLFLPGYHLLVEYHPF